MEALLAFQIDAAKKGGWTVISMKNDWKRLFPFEQSHQLRKAGFERAIPMSFGMLRLRVPEFAQSRLPIAFKRGGRCIRFVLVLFMLLCCSARQSYGVENLECPEIGSGSIPDLFGAAGGGLFTTENRVDLANEINEAINTLQIASPNISWSEVQNVLIAAYCRVVARQPGLAAAEKWARMRQFDSVLERQVAANMMPAGTLIIANVPLAPDVYRELKRQALVSKQTAAELMTAILTRAAGR